MARRWSDRRRPHQHRELTSPLPEVARKVPRQQRQLRPRRADVGGGDAFVALGHVQPPLGQRPLKPLDHRFPLRVRSANVLVHNRTPTVALHGHIFRTATARLTVPPPGGERRAEWPNIDVRILRGGSTRLHPPLRVRSCSSSSTRSLPSCARSTPVRPSPCTARTPPPRTRKRSPTSTRWRCPEVSREFTVTRADDREDGATRLHSPTGGVGRAARANAPAASSSATSPVARRCATRRIATPATSPRPAHSGRRSSPRSRPTASPDPRQRGAPSLTGRGCLASRQTQTRF